MDLTTSSITLGVSLTPNRHDRGWPRFSLHITTALSYQSYRWQIEAQGGVDSHDARGNSWEIVRWVPLRTNTYSDSSDGDYSESSAPK